MKGTMIYQGCVGGIQLTHDYCAEIHALCIRMWCVYAGLHYDYVA